MDQTLAPLQEKQRLTWIDAARGFAIFGIFVVNLPAFHGPYFLYGNGVNYWGGEEAGVWQVLIDIFFQASFYSLFSFLFGFGMQIIYENLKNKNIQPMKTMVRRLLILLIFGIIHAFLIWHGDILISYSIIGFLLLLFMNRKNKTLLIWSICLLLIPSLILTGMLFLVRNYVTLVNSVAIEASFQNFGSGSWQDILSQNLNNWLYANDLFNFVFITANLLPIFLLGVIFARNKWLHDVQKYQRILKRIWAISFLLFIIFKAGPYLVGNPLWLSLLQDTVGGTSSAVFYVISISIVYEKIPAILNKFANVGKMALSNYIFQSIVGICLFYSIGLGWYGELNPFQTIFIAIIVFPIQLFLSWLWLKYFQRGPLEWIWRSFVYKKILANKRKIQE
ncbi:uncharacterized protein SAMN04487944_11195 [Gracilibacillus ureilyticus]|uniref:DUF418 domain-containing protein n=1 Tax=Gracilibacillus ureilyticus TaxID=531814 RepID=A0A1H9SMU2_9BACI|nr:DUF418 domain-containing protein [Gracilibacillus ureilyticus]SER86208.1 uncharacterized protein SAMN04487944_11195 [Gracilibacillus ureilyticus]